MGTFLARRLLHMIPILLRVSLLTFLLMSLTPGGYLQSLKQNPQISPETVEKLLANFHLDKPWYVQYCHWLLNVAVRDFGYSVQYKISATELIKARLWNTFLLSFFATLVAWCVAARAAGKFSDGMRMMRPLTIPGVSSRASFMMAICP